jgi:hypothetical protein
MRNTTLIVVGTLLLGAALLSWRPVFTNRSTTVEPSPPGQFPIGAARYEWATQTRTAAYRPTAAAGSNDAATLAGTKDTKAVCALSPVCPQ